MNYHIRLLNETDFQVFKALRLELLDKFPTNFGSDVLEESAFEDHVWKTRLGKKDVDTYGLFTQNQLVGLCVIVKNPRKKMKHLATFHSMYIKPDFQNRGFATILMEHVIHELQKENIIRLNLSVVRENHKARNLYEKIGFTEYGVEPCTIFYNENYHDLILMTKEIY